MFENTPVIIHPPTGQIPAKQTFELGAGSTLKFSDSATPRGFTFTPAVGNANQCVVTIQAVDDAGNAVPGVFNFDLWLSDSATGAGLTATTASGAVANTGTAGADLVALVAKKMIRAQTSANGTYTLGITDAANTGFYVCAAVPFLGNTVVSQQLVAGNY